MAANNTGVSFTATAAGGLGVAQLSDILKWCLDGFSHPVPDNVTMGLAALIVLLAHILYAAATSTKDANKTTTPETTP